MKFAIILSGCGQHDGSETHEVILTLLSLAQEKIQWDAFAPDIMQHHVTNHLTNSVEPNEKRSVLKESARLVRGKIKPICEAKITDYDAIIFPGGMGAVLNLCDWAQKGKDFSFDPSVKKFIDQAVQHKIPMGFICIAPIMIPKMMSDAHLTIGNDATIAKQIHDLGSHHVNCAATDIVIDTKNKIVSTPANMVANGIDEVYEGIHKLVKALRDLK
jgi:enhancing lycopene biosynthesis protein 2